MHSNRTRVLVTLGSIAAIVFLLIVFAGGGGDEQSTVAQPLTTTTDAADDGGADKPEKPAKPAKPAEPEFETIVLKGGEPEGGVKDLTYSSGDTVRIEVSSDVSDEIHVHGYDISSDVEAGSKAKLEFAADIEGVFELELESAGVQIAQLTVEP